jgi:hypothetical protein
VRKDEVAVAEATAGIDLSAGVINHLTKRFPERQFARLHRFRAERVMPISKRQRR